MYHIIQPLNVYDNIEYKTKQKNVFFCKNLIWTELPLTYHMAIKDNNIIDNLTKIFNLQ